MFFTCLCQIMEKGGVIYGFDILMCRNHLTYVVLVLLMFALLIILGDMMCYLCYFTKNTSYSCFSHTKIQMGRLLFLLDWMHQLKQHMNKMYFRKHLEQDVPTCVPASEFVAKKSCSAKVLDKQLRNGLKVWVLTIPRCPSEVLRC